MIFRIAWRYRKRRSQKQLKCASSLLFSLQDQPLKFSDLLSLQHYKLVLWVPGNHEAYAFGSNLKEVDAAAAGVYF